MHGGLRDFGESSNVGTCCRLLGSAGVNIQAHEELGHLYTNDRCFSSLLLELHIEIMTGWARNLEYPVSSGLVGDLGAFPEAAR